MTIRNAARAAVALAALTVSDVAPARHRRQRAPKSDLDAKAWRKRKRRNQLARKSRAANRRGAR